MLHIVVYDISDAKRLRHVARTCEDFGVRVEYSVFECNLPQDRFTSFWKELNQLIDKNEDSLIAYTICGECTKKIVSAGKVARPGENLLYIL